MAFMAVLEADLRALSSEARRKYPAVKDGAEHAILKLRSLSDPTQIARNEDILKIFLLACEPKNVKLSAIGLSCLQKLIANDAVSNSALPAIITTLKDHSDLNDESVQLKTLQTILTILQSQLHPTDEDSMAIILGICLRLLANNRNADSVHSTAAATLRQAVALIFDRVVAAESLPPQKVGTSSRNSRSNSVSGDVSRSIVAAKAVETFITDNHPHTQVSRESLTQAGRLGLRLLEDLTLLAGGGHATWLHVSCLQRTFSLDMLEYVISHYVAIFRKLGPYEQVLRHQICSLLMTSLRTTREGDGEASEPAYRRLVLRSVSNGEGEMSEPAYRRLVLRSVSNVTRLYCAIVTTECEVFLNMLIKSTDLDLPLWHRIMVLEVLRGFCVEARVLRILFQTFDMRERNTNIVADIVHVLARVVCSVQGSESAEESLAAVAGMFNSKAKGEEWTMEYDASGVAVMVASEAHAITLAVEGLLGVVFTIATLTDEAIDTGELDSPRIDSKGGSHSLSVAQRGGELANICNSMVNAVWITLLDSLSLVLARSQGEAIVLEILKGYQAFTQACGVLKAVESRDAFLASLCKFALAHQIEPDKHSGSISVPSGAKRLDQSAEQRDTVVLSSKNVQALRTLFNVSHRLNSVLGTSWVLVLETLAILDRIIHSPHATTQEISAVAAKSSRDMANQSSDFSILSVLDAQLFESSAMMSTSAVTALLEALRIVSNNALVGVTTGLGSAASGSSSGAPSSVGGANSLTPLKMFALERMTATLSYNLHRAEHLWDPFTAHLLELAQHESPHVRAAALDVLDRSICLVLNCDRIQKDGNGIGFGVISKGSKIASAGATAFVSPGDERSEAESNASPSPRKLGSFQLDAFECAVILPLIKLYGSSHDAEICSGALKILLHVLERHGEKLYHSWPSILELLRAIANGLDKDLVPLGFQSVRFIMNDGLLSVPAHALDTCVEVAGAYGAQQIDINISLTAVGLLWTTADFFARGVNYEITELQGSRKLSDGDARQPIPRGQDLSSVGPGRLESSDDVQTEVLPSSRRLDMDCDAMLLAVYGVIQGLGTDDRPEVRNSAIRTLFQSISSHGHKLSLDLWQQCLWNLVFPLLDTVRHLAATSSRDEWQGKELGMQGGKPVHMLVHHSRNTAQKQWDETLVLVLNGMCRLLRPYFPFFHTLGNFKQGWDSLLVFIQESINTGSKEVALAAITALHTIVLSHGSKGTMPVYYFDTAFNTYEQVIQNAAKFDSRLVVKARQELLQNLGELYSSAYSMFNPSSYMRLLKMVDLLARCPVTSGDEPSIIKGSIPMVQRTVLDVLPQLKPMDERHISLWPALLRQLLFYLPGGDKLRNLERRSVTVEGKAAVSDWKTSFFERKSLTADRKSMTTEKKVVHENPSISENGDTRRDLSGSADAEASKDENSTAASPGASSAETPVEAQTPAFSEKCVSVILRLYLVASAPAKFATLSDVIAALGRCLESRRDSPSSPLWRTAVEAFNCIVEDALVPDAVNRPASLSRDLQGQGGAVQTAGRQRFWKEVADVYENFLIGACGRAGSSAGGESIGPEVLKADELLEISILDVLCEKALQSCQDASSETLERLVSVIDRCAARTAGLPVASIALLPPNCGRFSLLCLQKLFNLCSVEMEVPPFSSRITVSRVALPILIARCDCILRQFCKDEMTLGDTAVPQMRLDEVVFVFQELARLCLHPATASVVDVPVSHRNEPSSTASDHHRATYSGARFLDSQKRQLGWERAHLLLLFTSLCELVTVREARVKQLLRVLLRLVASELGLFCDHTR